MKIALDSPWEQYVGDRVRSGRYASETDVIIEALHLLMCQEELGPSGIEQLREEVEEGLASLDRGQFLVMDERDHAAYAKEVEKRGLERRRNQAVTQHPKV